MSKTYIANNLDAIIKHLESLDDSELVSMHNTYCQNNQDPDGEIYNNDEDFFTTFFDGKLMEAIRAVSYGEYNLQDDYVIFNGYANLESFNDPSGHVDLSAIASDILESPGDYDIELEDCFELDGVLYEGTEKDAKEQYEEYIDSLNMDEDPTPFADWVIENIKTID
jgi:hypothetical protein